jgi:hypothetical protein
MMKRGAGGRETAVRIYLAGLARRFGPVPFGRPRQKNVMCRCRHACVLSLGGSPASRLRGAGPPTRPNVFTHACHVMYTLTVSYLLI